MTEAVAGTGGAATTAPGGVAGRAPGSASQQAACCPPPTSNSGGSANRPRGPDPVGGTAGMDQRRPASPPANGVIRTGPADGGGW